MCTYKNGNTLFKKSRRLEDDIDREWKIDARLAYFNERPLLKQNDYRCLKPSKTQKPEKWVYYDIKGYWTAKSKSELKKVKSIKYDGNFFNFEDPKVFRDLTDWNKGLKYWKKTYGFDFVSFNNMKNQPIQDSECIEYCFKAETQKFATKCKKNGGFFKCCLTRYL